MRGWGLRGQTGGHRQILSPGRALAWVSRKDRFPFSEGKPRDLGDSGENAEKVVEMSMEGK